MKEWRLEQEFPEVPDCVHQTVLETLGQLEEKGRERKPVKKMKWIILAAALTAAFGLTVAAAELFDWNPAAAENFGEPIKEVQDKLTMDGVAKEQEISATDNGITVTAVQTMNDENVFYALLSVTAEEEIIDDNGYFEPELVTKNPNAFNNISMHFLPTGPAKQGYYEIYALKTPEEEWNEDSVTISLTDYSYYVYNRPKEELESYTDSTGATVKGHWKLTLPLGGVQTDNTVKTKEPLQVVMKGIPVTVEEVTLTPLAVKICYKQTDVEKLYEEVYGGAEDVTLNELFISGFVDKNGNESECGFTALSGGINGDKHNLLMGLGQAVDVHEVQAILLGEEKVRVELE